MIALANGMSAAACGFAGRDAALLDFTRCIAAATFSIDHKRRQVLLFGGT
jgi:hypothetical protein